jgi:hypothetical protein
MFESLFNLGMLVSWAFFIGQWLGVVGLGKANRNAAWWCMLAGAILGTLGMIGYHVITVMMAVNHSPGMLSDPILPFFRMATGSSQFGSLLFTVGFAIHGQQAFRAAQRIAELEGIAAAQGEELHRLRSNG